jgi:hypothetical protein
MRKVLAIAVMSAVALGGVTGCATNASTSPPPATTTADETRDVCDKASSAAEKGTTDALAKIDEIMPALAAGQGVASLKTELLRILDFWKATLYELKDKPIRPQVRTVLEETVAHLDELAAATRLEPVDIRSRFVELEGDLAAACA